MEIHELPDPSPKAGQVLVRVRATPVTSGDARIRAARFPPGFAPFARLALGLRGPRRPVLGGVLSGVVEAVGNGVTSFAIGDEVCGMTGVRMGAHAELAVAPAKKLAHKPPEVSHDEAAGLLFGATTALNYLRDRMAVQPGDTVLVNGASGAIGTSAVQLAVHLGGRVTGVTSGRNAALVTDLGAERTIDHTVVAVTELPDRFDVVLDAVGNLSLKEGRRLLAPGGRLGLAVANLGDTIRARGDASAGPSPERAEDFEVLVGLAASGALRVVIEQVYELDEIVEAHRRVDTGRKVGNVLVRPSPAADGP
ncbi:MAG: NAD(P)-dependent alcohol dehydrogenase [Actinomycetota bacterium]